MLNMEVTRMQKIMIVEDDFDIQELLQNFLQEAGYEISIANDGIEAIALFSEEPFDMILLDPKIPLNYTQVIR